MTGAPESFPVTEAYRGMRLDRFLQRMLPKMSRTSIQDAIATRVSLASGERPKPSRRPAVGDVVMIAARAATAPPDVPIPVLAEGAGWVVVDKPAGIAATPSSRRPGEDIAALLGLAPAHRLDRFTSGCLLLVRDAVTARHFEREFRERRVSKEYFAVVAGDPAKDRFDVDSPLAPDRGSRVPNRVEVTPTGAPAVTHFEVRQRTGDRALLSAVPKTGRRHQIRAHLAHAGHPIIGDLIYGGDERQFCRFQLGQPVDTPPGLMRGRHLLHAHRLTFVDPASGTVVAVVAPVPPDMAM